MSPATAIKHTRNPAALLLTAALIAFIPATSWAQAASALSTKAGDYIIHHSVFNSSFLSPGVAAIHGLTRGPDRAIVNVAVTQAGAGGDGFGLPAEVEGVARNLMQQSTGLTFSRVQEQNAVYYIAPFEFDDQEIMHFYIDVQIPGEKFPKEIAFTKKLYHD